ncbi:MAG: pyridoxal-phosphate dependent enzyme [Conexivisphaera sp.]
MRIELVDIEGLRSPVRPDLRSVLDAYRSILRSGTVEEPLIVHEGDMVLLGGFSTYEALDLLSARRAPALLLEDGEFRVAGDDPLGAVRDGRVLDEGAFSLSGVDVPGIRIQLTDLMGERSGLGRRVYRSTVELMVGDWPTPLVRLNFGSDEGREVWAKLEWYNPFSCSVKDRVAWAMIEDAARRGCLGGAFYEATSTNTGIALAALARVLGRSCRIYLPKGTQAGVDAYFRALGANVVRGAEPITVQMLDRVLEDARRDGAAVLNQFENDANFKVHLKHTAHELQEQLEAAGARPDYLVGALGTSGHLSAMSFHMKSLYGDSIKVIGVQPAPGSRIPGIRRIETGMKWIEHAQLDDVVEVSAEDALEGIWAVARSDGIIIGPSSGAIMAAVRRMDIRGTVAVVLPDNGLKYQEFLGSPGGGAP